MAWAYPIMLHPLAAGIQSSLRTSEMVARAAFLLLLLAGVIKSYSISRRPTTNSKACLGLACFLLGWCISYLCATALRYASRDVLALLPLAGLLAFATIVTGVVLAVLGLVEMRRHPARWNQGRRQATTTVVLGTLLLCVVGFVIFHDDDGWAARQPQPGHAGPGNDAGVAAAFRSEEFNFTFDVPERPWVQIDDAKKLNPLATFALGRSNPHIFFLIIAENEPHAAAMSSELLAEVARMNLASATSWSELVETRQHPVNGLNGVFMTARARFGERSSAHAYWLYARDGYAYQCAAWGALEHEAEIHRAVEQLVTRFHLIDQEPRRAPTDGTPPAPPTPL